MVPEVQEHSHSEFAFSLPAGPGQSLPAATGWLSRFPPATVSASGACSASITTAHVCYKTLAAPTRWPRTPSTAAQLPPGSYDAALLRSALGSSPNFSTLLPPFNRWFGLTLTDELGPDVTDPAITERFELANKRILTGDAFSRRAQLKRKTGRTSASQNSIYLVQMFYESSPDIARLTYKYPLAPV